MALSRNAVIGRVNRLQRDTKLLMYLADKYDLPDDRALAKFMGIGRTVLSQIRNDRKRLSADLILRIYDRTDLTIEQIREYARELAFDKYA